jgi:hypothetical protein
VSSVKYPTSSTFYDYSVLYQYRTDLLMTLIMDELHAEQSNERLSNSEERNVSEEINTVEIPVHVPWTSFKLKESSITIEELKEGLAFIRKLKEDSLNTATEEIAFLPTVKESAITTEEIVFLRKGKTDSGEPLPKDAYTFLVFASHWQSNVCAVTVVGLQLLIFVLVILDVVKSPEDELNSLSIPLEVNTYVRVTEVAAIVVAALTQTEVRTALNLIFDVKDESHGIFPKLFSPRLDGASYRQWCFSATLRCLVGCLSMCVSFLLIMQAGGVHKPTSRMGTRSYPR